MDLVHSYIALLAKSRSTDFDRAAFCIKLTRTRHTAALYIALAMPEVEPSQKETKKATFETLCADFNMNNVVLVLLMKSPI